MASSRQFGQQAALVMKVNEVEIADSRLVSAVLFLRVGLRNPRQASRMQCKEGFHGWEISIRSDCKGASEQTGSSGMKVKVVPWNTWLRVKVAGKRCNALESQVQLLVFSSDTFLCQGSKP